MNIEKVEVVETETEEIEEREKTTEVVVTEETMTKKI